MNTEIPELTIEGIDLKGWDEANLWAYLNDTTWHRVSIVSQAHGLTEQDTMKLLAYHLLKRNISLQNTMDELRSRMSPSFILPTDK